MCHSASHHIWIKKLWIAKSMSQEIGVSHLPCFVLNLIFISLYFVFDQLNDEYPAFCTLADDDLGCIESSALRYVTKRCKILQILQNVAKHCKILQNVAKHCIELWYIALAQWRMEAVGCIGCDRMHSVPSRPKMHCIALVHSTPVQCIFDWIAFCSTTAQCTTAQLHIAPVRKNLTFWCSIARERLHCISSWNSHYCYTIQCNVEF